MSALSIDILPSPFKLFRDLVKDGDLTIVMTTHDETMMELADVVYSLEDGKIAAEARNDIKTEKE